MKNIIVTLAVLLLLTSCSKNDVPNDPRMNFVGNFESNEYEMFVVSRNNGSVLVDSLLTVTGGTLLEISLAQGSADGLKVDVEELVDDAVTTLFSIGAGGSVDVNFEEDVSAQANGNDFEFVSAPFEISRIVGWTAPCTISGQGSIIGNTLSLEYQITIIMDGVQELPPESGFSLSGEVELTKQ